MSDRLYAILQMARFDMAGHELGPDQFPFGDGTGRRWDYKRAWATAKRKAHGIKRKWVKGKGKLSSESRAALKAINLRFHDLRHEGSSRMAEGGMPIHHVKEFLGHADLATTSRYLNVTLSGLKTSMRKLDEARARGNSVANEAGKNQTSVTNTPPTTTGKSLVN